MVYFQQEERKGKNVYDSSRNGKDETVGIWKLFEVYATNAGMLRQPAYCNKNETRTTGRRCHMNRIKIYLDTSVISYLDQQDAPERMKETQEIWELFKKGQYEIYISDVVVYEINKCSREKREILLDYLDQIEYTIIETDEGTVELAEKFIDFGFLKRKSYDDCRHIAAAILAGCDFIISWNFKHIVNVKTIRGIKAVTTYEGYKDLMIYPPSALLEEEDEDYGSDDKRT